MKIKILTLFIVILLGGCGINTGTLPQVYPNSQPTDETKLSDSIKSNQVNETSQPVDANPTPSQTYSAPPVSTQLPSPYDGTEVRVIVSGQELDFTGRKKPVMKDGEVFSESFDYIFAHLKDADGKDSAALHVILRRAVDGPTNTIIFFNSDYEIVIVEGENTFTKNGEIIPMAVPAQQIDGVLMVPLLIIAAAIEAVVVMDMTEFTLSIYY